MASQKPSIEGKWEWFSYSDLAEIRMEWIKQEIILIRNNHTRDTENGMFARL